VSEIISFAGIAFLDRCLLTCCLSPLLSFASFLYSRKKETLIVQESFSLLSFVSPKERSKERNPKSVYSPISESLDVALVLL
jgi:hypothetical protein